MIMILKIGVMLHRFVEQILLLDELIILFIL